MATFLDLPAEIIVQITDPAYIGQSTRCTTARTCKHLAGIIVALPGNLCDLAAHDAHLDILCDATARGEVPTAKTAASAAKSGSLQTLEYLRSIHCPWDAAVYAKAAANGHTHIIQYARDNGLPFDPESCVGAAKHGQLAVIEYLYANKLKIPYEIELTAAQYGQIPVLKLLFDMNVITIHIVSTAAQYAQYDVIEWFGRIYERHTWLYAGRAAVKWGRTDVLEWLGQWSNRPPYNSWWDTAIQYNQISVMDWLHAHHVPPTYMIRSTTGLLREWAIKNGYQPE